MANEQDENDVDYINQTDEQLKDAEKKAGKTAKEIARKIEKNYEKTSKTSAKTKTTTSTDPVTTGGATTGGVATGGAATGGATTGGAAAGGATAGGATAGGAAAGGAAAGGAAGGAAAGAAAGGAAAGGAAAGGAAAVAAAAAPVIIVILIIIIIIIYIFALTGFLSSMPGMFLGKLKETGMSFWRGVKGFITGTFDYVDSDDVIYLAQYLQNQGYDVQGYGFGDVKYKEDSEDNEIQGATKQIEEVMDVRYRRNYLHSYIAANEETYQLAKYSIWGGWESFGARVRNTVGKIADTLGIDVSFERLPEQPQKYSTGLLNIQGINESNLKVNREEESLSIYTSTELGRRFGNMYTYDLSGWTSKYGRPTELFIALHLALGMPDLTYQIATNKNFNTKVNINVQNVTIFYDTDDQLDVHAPGVSKPICKSDIEAAYYEHVIDRVRELYEMARKHQGGSDDDDDDEEMKDPYLELIKELESHRGIVEDIEKFTSDLYDNGFSISGAAFTAYSYTAGIEEPTIMLKLSGDYSHLNGADGAQLQELMDIVDYGKKGIKHANLPYIANVEKHWYYEDIEFTVGENGVYHASHQAIKDIKYNGEGTVLENFNIMIWDALLEDEDGTGIFYQVNEPLVKGPNKYIKELFGKKFYRYDGTIERAHAIAKATLINPEENEDGEPVSSGHGAGYRYLFNGKAWQLNVDDVTPYDNNLPEKQKPSFGTPTDTLSAFNILKQVHTEDADAVYRMLKELSTDEFIDGRIDPEKITQDLKQVLLWPLFTNEETERNDYDDSFEQGGEPSEDNTSTWKVSKDQDEYGIIIEDVDSETVIMPGDGKITTDGDKVIIEFDTLSASTIKILEKKFVEDDFYRINADIVKGKKMIIEGLDIDATVTSGTVTRGTEIGTARSEMKIVMQHEDKSVIGKSIGGDIDTIDDDIENYMNPSYTNHDEDMVIKSMENGGVATGGAKTSELYGHAWTDGSAYPDDDNNDDDEDNDEDNNGNNGGNTGNYYYDNYDKIQHATPVQGALSSYVGNDMDLVYAIVAAESLNTTESVSAVMSCLVNRLNMSGNAVFTGGKDMTTLLKVSGQWETFGLKDKYGRGSYTQYYPKSKLESTPKGPTVIKVVDDIIRTGMVTHNFNFFYASTEHFRNVVKNGIKKQKGDVTNWNEYCREIGGNFYYKMRGRKYVKENE